MKTVADISNPIGVKVAQVHLPGRTRHAYKPEKEKSGMSVFLVDDDQFFLKGLERSITSALPMVEVKSFRTGEACLKQMSVKPSVVILDYYIDSSVPNATWNGIDILRQIKRLNPGTKVIFLSAQDSLEIAIKCIEKGADDYISKSRSPFGKINRLLSQYVEMRQADSRGVKLFQLVVLLLSILILLFLFT